MLSFNSDSIFNLKEIKVSDVRNEVQNLLIPGEEILNAFKTVRDQIIFTTHRIIAIDVQGITGKKKEFSSIPYKMIQYFSVQTPGFAELIFSDSELQIFFANGESATFEFKGKVNILDICQRISQFTL